MALPASSVDLSPVDFTGQMVESLRDTFYTAMFMNPAIRDLVTVVPGIKAKKQVVVLGLIELVGKTAQFDNCAPDVSNQKATSYQKYWNPQYVEDRFIECWKTLVNQFWVWGLNNNIKKADLTGTDFAIFLEERIAQGLAESILRIMYFADRQAKLATNGGVISPNVTLSDGTVTAMDVRYINAIDGFWKQWITIGTNNPAQYKQISRNGGASYAAQAFTQADIDNQVITNILISMGDSADTRLSSDPNVMFWVTKSVADQYKAERRKAAPYVDLAYQRTESGFLKLEVDGRTIMVADFWDRFIRMFFNDGTKLYLPHRIAMVTKDNCQLGVEDEATMTDIEANYDFRDKQYYLDTGYSIDAMFVENYRGQFAY